MSPLILEPGIVALCAKGCRNMTRDLDLQMLSCLDEPGRGAQWSPLGPYKWQRGWRGQQGEVEGEAGEILGLSRTHLLAADFRSKGAMHQGHR